MTALERQQVAALARASLVADVRVGVDEAGRQVEIGPQRRAVPWVSDRLPKGVWYCLYSSRVRLSDAGWWRLERARGQ